MDPCALARLSSIVQRRIFKKNSVIFHEGEKAFGFYIVSRGLVKIYKLSPKGEERILHIVAAGVPFAEAVIFSGLNRYSAFLTSRVFKIPKDAFDLKLITTPEADLKAILA